MEQEDSSPFEIAVAILIAVVVVIGALVAWRASVIEDGSGDADYAGIRAVTNAEETRALNTVNAYESYGNYVNYWRNNRLAQLIEVDLPQADASQEETLVEQMKSANDLASASRSTFETRYLNRDGSYSVQRQMGEMWADASRQKDLDYESSFAEGDKLRGRSLQMMLALTIISIAPIFYALVETVNGKVKYVMVGIGTLFAIAGAVFAALIEFGIV